MDKNLTQIIISAVDKTGDELKSVHSNLGQVGDQATSVKTALAGFAAAAGVTVFASMIKGAIDAAAGMHDLAQKTGASVESLSALKGVAATSETSLETIGNAMTKMAKSMPDMADRSKDAAKALAAIGLEGDKIARMNTDDAFQAIAKGMAGVNDSAGKTAVAMALFGKSGAELIPFLNDLGVAGELQAKISKEQAALADNFGDNLTKLRVSSEAWKTEVGIGMVGALSDFSDGLVKVLSGAGGMREEVRRLSADHSIEEWSKSAIDGLLFLVDAIDGVKVAFVSAGSFAALLGKNIGTFASVSANRLKNLFNPAAGVQEMNAALADNKAFYQEYAKYMDSLLSKDLLGTKIKKAMGDAKFYRQQIKELEASAALLGGGNGKIDVDPKALASGNSEKATKQITDYERLTKAINEKIGAQELELASDGAVTEGEKERMKFLIGLRDNTIKMTDAEKIATVSLFNSLIGKEKELFLKKEIEKHDLAAMNRRADLIDAQQKQTQGILDGTTSLRDQTAELGLTAEELLHLRESRIDDQISIQQWNLMLAGGTEAINAEADAIRETIDALQDRKAAMAANTYKSIGVDAAKKAEEEWQKSSDKIGDSITDALMRGFESGKGFAQTLKDTVVNMFKTMILQPTIKAGVVGGMSALGLGGSSSAFAGAGNIASAGNNAYSLFNGGSSSLYTGFATSGIGQSLGLGTVPFYEATADVMIGSGLTGAGSTIGAAIPWVGIAVAVASLLMKDGGGPKKEGNSAFDFATDTLNNVSVYGGEDRDNQGGQDIIDAMLVPVSTRIEAIVKTLGGSLDGIQSSLFFNQDKEGDSPSEASATLYKNNQAIYWTSKESGRSDAELQAGLEVVMQRMSIAAIKAADGIEPIFTEILDGIDLTTATAEQMTQALSDVQSAVALRAAFDKINLGADNLSISLIKSAGGIDALSTNLDNYYQTYFTQEERTAKLADDVSAAFDKMNVAMPESQSGFRDLVESLDLTTTTGQDTFAALMSVQSAFAQITPAATDAAQSIEKATARERAQSTSRIQAAEAEAAATAASSRQEAMAKEAADRITLLRSGDWSTALGEALDEIVANLLSRYSGDTGALNIGLSLARVAEQQRLTREASADALNIQNIGQVLSSLSEIPQTLVENQNQRAREQFKGTDLTRQGGAALSYVIDASVKRSLAAQYQFDGPGLAGVYNAFAAQQAASDLRDTERLVNAALREINVELARGIITQEQYAITAAALNEELGSAVSGDAGFGAIVQAGISSLEFYFGKLGEASAALAKDAEAAAEPVALVSAAIGRLNSVSTIFGVSAGAAMAGGNATDMTDKAQLIALAAGIASEVSTTQSAADAAKRLAQTGVFGGNLRDSSMLIDGVTAYDSSAFEKAFLRVNDALAKGSITQEQYTALVSDSLRTYSGVTDAFDAVTEAAKSLADQLLLDAKLSSLTQSQSLAEAQRQYQIAYAGTQSGDASASASLNSVTRTMLEISQNQATNETDYNRFFGTTIGEIRKLEISPIPTPSGSGAGDTAALIKQLEALRAELRAALAQVASNTGDTVKRLDEYNINGMPTVVLS